MPELPEVENVCRSLQSVLGSNSIIDRLQLLRPDLRDPIPRELVFLVKSQKIEGVSRRAKYLLLKTKRGSIISHLGMTGSWRLAPAGDERDHDHVYLHLRDGRRLAFRDPRRFGILDWVKAGEEHSHPRFCHLGPEPLNAEEFSGRSLYLLLRQRNTAIKTAIMNQEIVVGVGNIYASEALHRAGIRPQLKASRLSAQRSDKLVASIRQVLTEAIEAGGSSIRDYRKVSGDQGGFQKLFRVYDRAGEPCLACGSAIRHAVIGARSTYWCPECQT